MSEQAQRWKEKYLHSLEQQDLLEERWNRRLDLLRRSLVRSSFAVEGTDPAIEQSMHELRAVLRDGDLDDGLSALVPRLERAVLDAERDRQERIARLTGALDRLVEQLLALPLPSEVRKPLKRFAKRLDARAAQVSELPALLGELSELQERVLTTQASAEKRPDGLFQRLFGHAGRSVVGAGGELGVQPDVATADMAPGALQSPPTSPLPVSSASAGADGSLLFDPLRAALHEADVQPAAAVADVGSCSAEDEAADEAHYSLPALPEQAYSAIAEHVEATLFGLLDDLQLPEHFQPQAETLHERIGRGLNWYELAPVLDDLAVLMIAASNQNQRDFESYLQQLNERLAAMQDNLSAAHEGRLQSQKAAQVLDEELRQHVGGLQHSVLDASDLPSLKQAVQARLDGLLVTADAYQRQHSQHEKQLSERLQQLVARVTSLEQAAGGLHQRLEEQRQKALVDALTELPNRAAWDERLKIEVARWQRYGGELVLAVLDVDHFKRINDSFGHMAGDRVLKIIAGELHKRLRQTDFMARFGGEEFALLLPQTSVSAGLQVLNALREGIQLCPFHFKGEPIPMTLSGGLSAFVDGDTAERVFERADRALYKAKGSGRNRIEPG